VDDAAYSTQKLLMARYVDGAWTSPEPASFTAGFEKSGEPFFSADGKRLFFTAKAKDSKTRMDFWVVERSGRGWGAPVRLPSPINLGTDFNSADDEYGANLSPDGKYLFFVRHSAEGGELHWVSTRAIERLRH
jgi:Tol biopolymer transport system component